MKVALDLMSAYVVVDLETGTVLGNQIRVLHSHDMPKEELSDSEWIALAKKKGKKVYI